MDDGGEGWRGKVEDGGGGGRQDEGVDADEEQEGGTAEKLENYLEEVTKVVGVAAFAVCDPDANTIDPVTKSLWAGTSSEVG